MSEPLSSDERLALLQTLNRLPSSTFEEIRYALGAPRDVLPGEVAPQGNRGVALLDWATGPTGCGLPKVQQVLRDIVARSETTSQSDEPSQQAKGSYYDLRGANFAGGFAETVHGNQFGGTQFNAAPETEEPTSQAHWLVPYPQNPFFTGRENLLQQMRATLTQQKRAAFRGLGGIGKTQTAVEYVYRYQSEYKHIFWVRAEPAEELLTGYTQIAQTLQLPGYDPTDRPAVVGLVNRWFEANESWLLVIDNADDLRAVRSYLPLRGAGHLLLTTRAQALGDIAQPLEITKMGADEGALFLLRRVRLLSEDADLSAASEADLGVARAIVEEMDGLPLALDQAGAYIEEQFLTLEEYQELFQAEKAALLQERGQLDPDHPSVTVTFKLAFEKVAQQNAAAADLLRVCALLAPDEIPEEIFSIGSAKLGKHLRQIRQSQSKFIKVISNFVSVLHRNRSGEVQANNKLTLSKAIAEAARFSLISRNPQTKTLTIHRLVQEVLRAEMDEESQKQWASEVIEALGRVFPDVEKYENWVQCDRVAAHAQAAAQLMADYELASETAAWLLAATGYYFKEQGRYEEAEPIYLQALKMNQQLLGQRHPHVAISLNNLAVLYKSQGRYEEAEPLYLQALEMRQQLLGKSHPQVATSLNNLAVLYKSQGRYEEAEPLYLQALEMRQQLLGKSHPQVATSLNNLALLYDFQGRYEEAEPLYLQALEMRQQLLGQRHPQVATSLNNLALLYKSQGRYEEAEPLYLQALEMFQQLLGKSHPAVATSLNNLALLYKSQGRYEEAEPLYRQALEMRQQLLGQRHPEVATSLNNLASLYRDQGRYEEAEPLYRQALEMRHQLLGQRHPEVATSLNNLASLYQSQGRYEAAEPLYQQALAICEQILGPEHPHTQGVKGNLQNLLEKKG